MRNINHLFEVIDGCPERVEPTWKAMHRFLGQTLQDLHGHGEAFRQIDQAEAVLRLVFDSPAGLSPVPSRPALPPDRGERCFQPFFIGRACEAVLAAGRAVGQKPSASSAARSHQLNDYLGHRPVAVLRTQQKIQPYAHEWVRPIPLCIRGAGVAVGRYHDLVERALAILEATDPIAAVRGDVRSGPRWTSWPSIRGPTTSTIR